jgi:ribosomal protein S18 acetylase RimI-like enzyme
MIEYRTFRNSDPPVLATIWNSRAGQRGLMQPITPDLLEQIVFAKLYFDYDGLFVAWEDGRPVGFAHAGFGPNEAESDISTELGVTSAILVEPDCSELEVAAGLLAHCEEYLRGRGAKVFYGGGIKPLNPFYLGLYGGSELPGVLDSDTIARQIYPASGYREIDRTVNLRRELCNFEAPIDRYQMQIRRRMIAEVEVDPLPRTWWEACTTGDFDLTRFDLLSRSGGRVVASATFRSMAPTGTYVSGGDAGLIELWVDEALQRRGLAVFILSEACRQFIRDGIDSVEAQVMIHNAAALALYRKLGFQQVSEGSVFRKE